MKKMKKLIVGNWKMNPERLEEAKQIATEVKRSMRKIKKTEVVLCPPFVYLSPLSGVPKGLIFLGAQNANHERMGSLTGEVSFSELRQFNVSYVILGHSERRKMGETDELINRKVRAVVGEGMTAILCIGENERDGHGDYFDLIKKQIVLGLKDVNKKFLGNIVIAYEPVWAIGAKDSMSPTDLLEMSIFIKKILNDMYGVLSESIRIIYGGSADRVNADKLVQEGGVSGLLIGRESLKPKSFVEIIRLIDSL